MTAPFVALAGLPVWAGEESVSSTAIALREGLARRRRAGDALALYGCPVRV